MTVVKIPGSRSITARALFLAAAGRGVFRFDASAQMRRRPLGPLTRALSDLGVDLTHEAEDGRHPLTVRADGIAGGSVVLDAGLSSQFLTALLLVGPLTAKGLDITVTELAGTAALLATQPVPLGSTVAIVSNVGGAGVLTADACTGLGLTVHRPHEHTRRRLRALIPKGGAADGPVDTTAAVSADRFRECLELAAADEEVSAMIALVLPTGATGDLVAAIRQADIRVPLAVVLLNQAETVRLLPGPSNGDAKTGGIPIPAYNSPEAVTAAVSRAARHGAWRAAPR